MLGQTFNPLLCDDTPDFTLGTVALDDDGNAWIYFEAGADIGRYNAVQLPDEAYEAVPAIATATDEYGMRVAVPHVAIPIGSFGWGMIYGSGPLSVLAGTASHVVLRTSETAGVLDDANATNSKTLSGLSLTSTQSAAGNHPAQFNWPQISS